MNAMKFDMLFVSLGEDAMPIDQLAQRRKKLPSGHPPALLSEPGVTIHPASRMIGGTRTTDKLKA